jgi:hypothetical protein
LRQLLRGISFGGPAKLPRKVLGRPSHGSLDYSNLRPHRLPSGERLLLYATSRSNRLPDLPIDLAGVQPDIYLPEPADEVARTREVLQVQRWLEQGSLKAGRKSDD